MPVYEYVCDECQERTESLRPMRDADAAIACSHCGGRKTRRVQSVFATAAAGSASGREASPVPACGRCGDPRGSCGM